MKAVRFLEAASAEFEAQIGYFDEQLAGLGDRFDAEVRSAIALVREHPQIGRAVAKHLRKLRLRKFPFNVIYALDAEEVVIVAIAPHRRKPNYWRDRLR